MTAESNDLLELAATYHALTAELRHTVRSNLTILSLMTPRSGMPDPGPERGRVVNVLRRLEAGETDLP